MAKKRKAYLSNDVQDYSSNLGSLFKIPKTPKVKKEQKKKAKKVKKVKPVEDMTAGERAQYEAGKVTTRLYGAKAKAPKFT